MVAIYKISAPSGKINIGQSWDVSRRWNDYKNYDCHDQRHLYNSLIKYGVENHTFEIEIVLREDITQDLLNWWEQFYMDYYRSQGLRLLNLKEAGSRGKHNSIKEVQEQLKIQGVSRMLKGNRPSAGGFIWKYKENKNVVIN